MACGETSEEALDKLLLFLLYGTPGYEHNEDGYDLRQWFSNLQERVRKNILNMNPLEMICPFHTPVLKQLFSILRECLLSHRWKEALQIMTALSQEHSGCQETIFRVGLALFHQDDSGSERILQQLIKMLAALKELNSKEVCLEFVFFLLNRHQISEAQVAFTNSQKAHALRRFDLRKDQDILRVSFRAYEGLLYYLEWLQAKCRRDQLSSQQGQKWTSFSAMDSTHEASAMMVYAEKAVTCLSVVENETGVWDIFMTKYVELLVFLNRMEEAESTLQKYAKNNSNNPNAWKYLCDFYKAEDRLSDYHEVLQDVAALVPSDRAALELCKVLANKGEVGDMMVVLFSLLDFPCWQEDEEPWQLLSDRFLDSSDVRGLAAAVEGPWSERHAWWPEYHFTPDRVDAESGASLTVLEAQALVAAIFGVSDDFVEKVASLASEAKHNDWLTSLEKARQMADDMNVS